MKIETELQQLAKSMAGLEERYQRNGSSKELEEMMYNITNYVIRKYGLLGLEKLDEFTQDLLDF